MIILYVDKLLGREEIAALGQDDYDLLKKFFANLSHELLTEYNDKNYSISYGELTTFIEKFKSENIRFVTDTRVLLDYLINKGILRKNTISDRYLFRLNGVMEYFTSVYMNNHSDFVKTLLKDENDMVYLEFSNELEILSGLSRGNETFLDEIFKKTKKALKKTNEKYDNNPDITLKLNIKNAKELAKFFKGINVNEQLPISYEEQDEMLDEIKPIQTFKDDVKVKKPQKRELEYTHTQLEKHLFILSRVFRSMSSVENKPLMCEIFEFVIDSYINLGFDLLNKFEFEKERTEKEIEKRILSIFANFIPVVTQLMLSDSVLHVNLKRLIEQRVSELEKDKDNNQYKLLILYFMLLDIDLNKNKERLNDIKEKIKLLSLKNAALLKLYYYLNFKSFGNSALEDILKENIISIQKELYPDIDEDKLRNKIDKSILITKRQQ